MADESRRSLDAELVRAARDARENAYAPYSGFCVGSAVRTADGKVYTGSNVECVSFGLTCCAERVAIFKAVSEGHRRFDAIAVVAGTNGPTAPCGACRQVMYEFAPEIRIIMEDINSERKEALLKHYLPDAFGPDDAGLKRE